MLSNLDDVSMSALLSEDPNYNLFIPEGFDFYDVREARSTNRSLYKDMDDPVRRYFAKRPPRLIIYPKDVAVIFGKTERFGRNLLQLIRESLGKSKGMPVTFFEFCKYTEMDEDTVHDFIMES